MKVLVTTSTMVGSTTEVAKMVHDTLAEQGFTTDLKPVGGADILEG
jgi:flavodoxin